MENPQAQLVDKLKAANNILVTVSRNPSVDQLAACLGLTLLLNKLDKHAAAVFSGQIPSTLEFLKPEETIEKNTDSLRDFIIALDKSKADKLRYKVEDDVVRIFITPYKTSITQDDLDFTQGDFNVDVVVALGVQQQEDLDEAITAHGRILHDATVASITTMPGSNLGVINWQDPNASSLSELMVELGQSLGLDLFDNQIATALLTGIVSETERFSNQKTTASTMSASAALMAAGADQQLVASQLEVPAEPADDASDTSQAGDQTDEPPKPDDGSLEIDHANEVAQPKDETDKSEPDAEAKNDNTPIELPAPTSPDDVSEEPAPDTSEEAPSTMQSGSKLVTEPPTLGGVLTANTQPEGLDPTTDPMSTVNSQSPALLSHGDKEEDTPKSETNDSPEPINPGLMPPPPTWTPPEPPAPTSQAEPANEQDSELAKDDSAKTLSEIEASVKSAAPSDAPELDAVRDEVSKALNDSAADAPLPPVQALNAQPLADNLHATDEPSTESAPPSGEDAIPAFDPSLFQDVVVPDAQAPAQAPSLPEVQAPTQPTVAVPAVQPTASPPAAPQVVDPNAPPPVPPPIPFQFGASGPSGS